MNCTAPFCGRCGTYGHDGKGCSLPCRRCGDPHATVACTIRRSYSEAASKDFPPLQPETPATDKGEVLPTPVPGPAQDQNSQDATPHPTPAASPVSPDPANACTADDQVCVSRPPVITIERHAGTSLHSVSAGRTDADDSVTSDINHAASSSSANPPTIEESPSTDDSVTSSAGHAASSSSANPPTIEESSSTADGTVHIEDSDSSSSETPLQIDEDATPSDVSRESVDVLVPPSVRSSSIKRHRVSSSDSETHSRDRSPLRTPTRPRKPRASGASPGRKK
ncbi:hypothetical protein HPB52_014782 [Rhipicephalus sanguineus]|uniref:CCHC-type domain-containing protein n=1 Tax=Rhipicephalus sanguineus TaxID=34632 RepID=A0A9D4TAG1_RHISA|nr:hypothetical protein HPB52_014782 [Rhipicephalus sanguineus]